LLYRCLIVAYVDFLHHPTFPREATRGDFFAVWRTLLMSDLNDREPATGVPDETLKGGIAPYPRSAFRSHPAWWTETPHSITFWKQ